MLKVDSFWYPTGCVIQLYGYHIKKMVVIPYISKVGIGLDFLIFLKYENGRLLGNEDGACFDKIPCTGWSNVI